MVRRWRGAGGRLIGEVQSTAQTVGEAGWPQCKDKELLPDPDTGVADPDAHHTLSLLGGRGIAILEGAQL